MPTLLDQHGKPIERSVLREPQTARLGHLDREYALHPARGLTPARLHTIMENAERGDLSGQSDLFTDMENRDAHILCEIGKRKRVLLGLEWDVVPPRNPSAAETKGAAYAKDLIGDLADFEDLLLDMGDAIGKGFACLEIAWRLDGREWMPEAITHRPQRWFKTDPATRTELRLRDASADGAPLNPFGWVVHTHKAMSGYVATGALYRTLAWPYLFKNYSVRDLAEFLEIYGLPVRIGTYPQGASAEEKATLLAAVAGIGHSAAGIIPEGMLIEFKEAAKGQSDPYMLMIEWAEKSQSKAILGHTLSAEAKATGLGSGMADLAREVRYDIMRSDAAQIASTLTRDLIYPLLVLNGAPVDSMRRCPRFVFDTAEPEDMTLYADALPKLAGIGLAIPASYAYAKLKIPEPKDDEPVLGAPAAPDPAADPAADPGADPAADPAADPKNDPAGKPQAARTVAARTAPPPADQPDAVDLQAERLAADARGALRPAIDRLQQMTAEATSLQDLRDRLLTAYGHLPLPDLQRVMALAFTAAEAAGRFEVTKP